MTTATDAALTSVLVITVEVSTSTIAVARQIKSWQREAERQGKKLRVNFTETGRPEPVLTRMVDDDATLGGLEMEIEGNRNIANENDRTLTLELFFE